MFHNLGEFRCVCRIAFNNKDIYFRFKTLEDMNSCDREVSILKTLLDDFTRIKFKFLAEDEALLHSYESLVLRNIVSEEEFWNQKEEIREWNKISNMASQPLARTSKNLIKSIYTGGNTNIEGLKLDEMDKMKLLKREKKLMDRYLFDIKEKGMRDEEFWSNFEIEQREKNTVLIGGINPIYVGEDEFEYREEKELDLEVDIVKNSETFDLTAKFLDNSNKNDKKSLIDKFNERNIRVLNEELLAIKDKKFDYDSDLEGLKNKDKTMIELEKESFLFGNKKLTKDNERKPYSWEEEAWIQVKKQIISLNNENSEYKAMIFDDENKQIRNVFEQMLRSINQRLSKKSLHFSHNEEEYKNFEKNWKTLQQEANKVLTFFYLNLKKIQEEKDEKLKGKVLNNCKEIAGILFQLREKLNKFKANNSKFGEIILKCLNNLHDRLDIALKQLS